jgi:DNA ligase 1
VTLLRSVVDAWRDVRAAKGRLKKRDRLATLFGALTDPAELRLAVLYLAGELGQPPLGAGGALVAEAFEAAIERAGPPLGLKDVDAALAELSAVEGEGAKAKRLAIIRGMLARAEEDERELIASLILGELRQGALGSLVMDALAKARELDPKKLRRAVMLAGSLGDVALAVGRDGAAALARFELTLLTPVEPMLAGAAGPLDETIASLGGVAAAEWKLDGIRLQVHKKGDEVRLFTRSLRDVTTELPGVVALARALPCRSVVLDGEAVGFAEDEPLKFQDTMSAVATGGVEVAFFDVLLLDDEVLVDRPDSERRALLERVVPKERLIPRAIVRTEAEARAAMDEALDHGHEGIILKSLDAPYVAGRRGKNWRKLKPVVTVDLVVLGAEWGHGRREGWLSNLHLGARDPQDATKFLMVGKTFKGLTDAMLEELTRELPPLITSQRGHVVKVRPERVVEIAFDSVMRSSRYEGGIALRFARVKRFRPDKRPQDATTIDEMRGLL